MNKQTIGDIYALVDPRDQRVRYVGFSRDPRQRLIKHIKNAREGKLQFPVVAFVQELIAAGLVPAVRVLEVGVTIERESHWIQQFRQNEPDLLNLSDGGIFSIPAEARKRAGQKLRGRTASAEARQRISASKLGKKRINLPRQWYESMRRLGDRRRGKARVLSENAKKQLILNGQRQIHHLRALTPEQQSLKAQKAWKTRRERYGDRGRG
jgi:hypothetical protein